MKTLIAIPCLDMIRTEFLRSLLGLELSGEVQYTFAQNTLIYDGRNQLAGVAMDGGFDAVLWLDSDMVVPSDLLKRMIAHFEAGREMVTGLYFTRRTPVEPVIYRRLYFTREDPQFPTPHAESMNDYPKDSVFPVYACGFGAVMTSTALIRRVRERFGLPFSPQSGWGEDLSFCIRAHEVGATITCDSTIKCGHVGKYVYDESAFSVSRVDH